MQQSTMTTDEYGNKKWWLNGKLHRTDGPAVEQVNGTKVWYLNGKRHRTDGPAVEWVDGNKDWYLNGERHRTDGAAVEWTNGYKEWYLDGKHLGDNAKGFWTLWRTLKTPEQRDALLLNSKEFLDPLQT